MGKILLAVPDALEQEFRIATLQRKGSKKGSLSESASEAFRVWIDHPLVGLKEQILHGNQEQTERV